MTQDFIAAAKILKTHKLSNGKVGVVGFCFGGVMANALAVRIPRVVSAAVPFYGRQPAADEVKKIKAPLLLHYAEYDERVNAGWPAYEQALKSSGVDFTAYVYEDVNHGFKATSICSSDDSVWSTASTRRRGTVYSASVFPAVGRSGHHLVPYFHKCTGPRPKA
jgi:carboxymethylenebutenolidase